MSSPKSLPYMLLCSVAAAGMLAALVPGLAAQPAPPQTAAKSEFTIRLERGARVGSRFLLEAEARISDEEAVTDGVDKQVESSGEGTVRLAAEAEVLAVDSQGGITRAEYVVRSFEGKLAEEAVGDIPQGSVLTSRREGPATLVSLAGGELTPQQQLLLIQVLETAREDQPGDDELFGTAQQQSVGSTWPVHPAEAVKAFSGLGFELDAQAVSGSSRLVEKRTIDGAECLHITGRLEVAELTPPGIDDTVFSSARMVLEYEGDYPTDGVSLPRDGKVRSRLEVRHLLFEAEGEDDVPLYHLRTTATEKSYSIRQLSEDGAGGNGAAQASPGSGKKTGDPAPASATS